MPKTNKDRASEFSEPKEFDPMLATCPKCGKVGRLEHKPGDLTRAQLSCECNPPGPTLETDYPTVPPDHPYPQQESNP